MFGPYNKLVLFISCILLLSCKEQNINPIYKDIPAKYNHVFNKLRSLTDTSVISVKNNTGLSDQLLLTSYSSEKKYLVMFRNYAVPGNEDQQYFLEYYSQVFTPSIYQFYNIHYSIDFLYRNTYEADTQDPENYYAEINVQNKNIFNISLLNSTIISDFPYELLSNYTVDGIEYNDVYSLNITDASKTNDIKRVFFTLSEGIIKFETMANEIFTIRI